MPYVFSSSVLSAAKTPTPAATFSLSANGINTISLSTNDVGLAYNALTTLSTVLSTLTVNGSVFAIDTAYSCQQMALVTLPVNNMSTYTVLTYLSSLATTPVSSYDVTPQVSTPGTRRKWLLGYR